MIHVNCTCFVFPKSNLFYLDKPYLFLQSLLVHTHGTRLVPELYAIPLADVEAELASPGKAFQNIYNIFFIALDYRIYRFWFKVISCDHLIWFSIVCSSFIWISSCNWFTGDVGNIFMINFWVNVDSIVSRIKVDSKLSNFW